MVDQPPVHLVVLYVAAHVCLVTSASANLCKEHTAAGAVLFRASLSICCAMRSASSSLSPGIPPGCGAAPGASSSFGLFASLSCWPPGRMTAISTLNTHKCTICLDKRVRYSTNATHGPACGVHTVVCFVGACFPIRMFALDSRCLAFRIALTLRLCATLRCQLGVNSARSRDNAPVLAHQERVRYCLQLREHSML
jgi:hypothetical protein